MFELDLSKLMPLLTDSITFNPLPRFPAVERDITLIVDNHVPTGDIVNHTESLQENLMESISVFDIFSGNPIPMGKKSVSFRITYRSSSETLQDKLVNSIHQQITDRLVKEFNASLPV